MWSDAPRQPEVVVFAGPNGSGKSTITGPEWIKGEYINADDIQRRRRITTEEAAALADEWRQTLLDRRETFTFETVLSTERKLDFLRRAKEKGYFIRGYFILTCDPMLNVARVRVRVISGLHDVPEDKIISRYAKALANVPAFLALCDICHIYDNTDEPFRICRKHKDSITLYENAYWTYDAVSRLVFPGREE